jgi:hypothetical protein
VVLAEKHNLSKELRFRLKLNLLVLKRKTENLLTGHKKFQDNGHLKEYPVISFSESDLWNPDDNDQNWILTAGKIQNLRIAVKNIHGIEVPANAVFSFWKHIGNPNIGKGYVVGREIREGCIVPTKAGGLCQLSNALYDAALKADFKIIERHKHTQVIKGSLAEMDRDATVKWNYIDLRFKSDNAFRINAELTTDKLIISFKGIKSPGKMSSPQNVLTPSKLNDCYSCGNIQCFKHPTGLTKKQKILTTTFVLDESWPEYDEYIGSVKTPNDIFILPLPQQGRLKSKRYKWLSSNGNEIKTFTKATLLRSLSVRFAHWLKKNPFKSQLNSDNIMGKSIGRLIPLQSTHLIISQNLLPSLYKEGILAGRTYDVLMTRLPTEKLHEHLDLASNNHPESRTLNDFRTNQEFIDIENRALTQSRKIITPHTEIASMFKHKCIYLNWKIPSGKEAVYGTKILYPGPTIGRKGAYEARRLAKELEIQMMVMPNFKENAQFWNGVSIELVTGNPLNNVGLIIYPTYIEHQPRFILKGLSMGITIITSSACGIPPSKNLVVVKSGNYQDLKKACLTHLDNIKESISNP